MKKKSKIIRLRLFSFFWITFRSYKNICSEKWSKKYNLCQNSECLFIYLYIYTIENAPYKGTLHFLCTQKILWRLSFGSIYAMKEKIFK